MRIQVDQVRLWYPSVGQHCSCEMEHIEKDLEEHIIHFSDAFTSRFSSCWLSHAGYSLCVARNTLCGAHSFDGVDRYLSLSFHIGS